MGSISMTSAKIVFLACDKNGEDKSYHLGNNAHRHHEAKELQKIIEELQFKYRVSNCNKKVQNFIF